MSYFVELIKSDEQKTTTWTGGTTTELAIYPKYATYKHRNFKWRLSSATVEVDTSTFTALPNIWRYIMVLQGEMTLEHEGHHNSYLKPFEKDSFSGAWLTRSFGKVRDFNLMLGEGCEGDLNALHFEENSSISVKLEHKKVKERKGLYITEAFYCLGENSEVEVTLKDELSSKESIFLKEKELLLVHMKKEEDMEINMENCGDKTTTVIRATILYQ